MKDSVTVVSTAYHRDPSVPFWLANIDVEALFENQAHRPERAQAWLRYRQVAENCFGFQRATLIRGRFKGGILGNHTYYWTFTPTFEGEPAIALPVYEQGRLVDLLAMSRHDHTIWGGCTGAGQYLGDIAMPLRVHRTPAGWLANDCDGILPLRKSFFPWMQFAPSIVAEDDDHAWNLAYRVFIDPAADFGADQAEAEELAFSRIEVRA